MHFIVAATLVIGLAVTPAWADVTVGAVLALTGPAAMAGADAKAAVETALDIVNTDHDAMPVLMGVGKGLARLDGAKLHVTFADDAGDPAKAEAEAERMVTTDHVVALTGGSSSAAAAAIRSVAQKHELPYLAIGLTPVDSPDFPWCFTIGATPEMSAAALFGFVRTAGDAIGHKLQTLALVFEDRPTGLRAAEAQRQLADENGLQRVVQINLKPGAPNLTAEAEQIIEKKPDVLIATLGEANATMLMRALADRNAAPLILAQGGGFGDSAFVTGLGPMAEHVFGSFGFVADLGGARPALPPLAAAFQTHSGHQLDPASAQVLTGMLLLADVINRAGTTKPEELRIAFMSTNTPAEEIPMAWEGIRFNDRGQNVLATPVIAQVQGGVYRTVAPKELSATAPVFTPPP